MADMQLDAFERFHKSLKIDDDAFSARWQCVHGRYQDTLVSGISLAL